VLVAPCSVKSLSGIAHCYNDELVVRAADVCLKERRRVVLLFRGGELRATGTYRDSLIYERGGWYFTSRELEWDLVPRASALPV